MRPLKTILKIKKKSKDYRKILYGPDASKKKPVFVVIMVWIFVGIEVAMEFLPHVTLENIAFPMKTGEIFCRKIVYKSITVYAGEHRLTIEIDNSAGKDHPAFTPFF